MPHIDAATVSRLVQYSDLMDALETAHCEERPLTDRSLLQAPDGTVHSGESFLVLPAWRVGRYMGARLTTVIPANADRNGGLPVTQGVYQLFDGETGSPLATIDSAALSLHATAADSALGARLLAREDAATLLIVGAGAALAPHLVAAHCAAHPRIGRVLLWDEQAARRQELAEALHAEHIGGEPVDSLRGAVDQADIICSATASMQPLIHGEWLRPGQHLDLVGSFRPSMREVDDECVRRAALFVDSRDSTIELAGDLFHPMSDGVIGADAVQADLFELCLREQIGRERNDDITLFKNGGGAHLDLFTAEHVYRRCIKDD